ncbi:hypothetical protein L228DRAFT_217203 [Xylona heveae TC161]|uniref:Homeobox domain-containing protein n=1 Tax=Xylona heveae (strain CBS 132557 / TC161) TaxID=1328760 RepID=A0A165IFH6_XYLHT|nr:hypothetical protein L228DRAFT_217203 [Xylona heveae TC161]KZF24823.1 hypothetical protein L228DRAFT_217203 [Xylona heveae TC161]
MDHLETPYYLQSSPPRGPIQESESLHISHLNDSEIRPDDSQPSSALNAFNNFNLSSDGGWPFWIPYDNAESPEVLQLHGEDAAEALQRTNQEGLYYTHLLSGTINQPTPRRGLSNVSQWLDGAYNPPVPCTYCRKHRLQCLIIRTTPANPNPVTSCSSCVALFRECSLAQGEKRHPSEFETLSPVLGHLHGVPEHTEDAQEKGNPNNDIETPAKGKEPKHFVRKGARILKEWFHEHEEYPYPSEEESSHLSQRTGFTKKRISTWFANARRRQKQKIQCLSKPRVFRAGSPMPTSKLASMTPIERWRMSPPEDEPAPESAIQRAISSSASESDHCIDPSLLDLSLMDPSSLDEASSDLASSVSSLGGRLSDASSSSLSSAWSYNSSQDQILPFPLPARGSRSIRRRERQRQVGKENQYQCTFCVQSFKKKHDWCRHEKSVHLSLESWVCTPDLYELQPSIPQPSVCRYCDTLSPSHDHWEQHEFYVCSQKPVAERSFRRKDYLWQHLRKFHGCTKPPVADLDTWRDAGEDVRSRCGFCNSSLPTWGARANHLAVHFKNGSHMDQWVGDWGFDSSVLSFLRNGVLPSQRAFTDLLDT